MTNSRQSQLEDPACVIARRVIPTDAGHSMTKTILIAALFHETHSFVEQGTSLDDFSIKRGAELLARRGDASTIDGFLEVADEHGWTVIPANDYQAAPAGPVDHSVFVQFTAELLSTLRDSLARGRLDGIWLSLHGAHVTTESVDVEGDLLRMIRTVPGAETLPVFGVFDLHANFTELMSEGANCLVAYRENPHTDSRDMAVLSARLLARCLNDGAMPRMYTRNAPVMWAPPGTGTADSPMKDLEALARQIEAEDNGIWVANVIGGYSFSDVPSAGVAFSVVTTGPAEEAAHALDRLEQLAVDMRELGQPPEWDLDAAVLDIKSKSDGGGPFLIVEPSDNIGGGAPGDDTAVLRAFLRHGIDNAAVAIADAEAVAALASAKPGDTVKLTIGGKGSKLGAGPLEVEGTFLRRSDGKYVLEDRNSHIVASRGVNIDMGPSAVIHVAGVTVLLSSVKMAPADLGQLRSQGIIPESLKAIGIKAAVQHRRAYDKIMRGSYTVSTPGPCTSNIATLPFRRLRAGVFPFDA
jgi:microcystin degradation protein MlrC